MALVPATLAAQIQSIITNANPNAPVEASPQIQSFCNQLAVVIDSYLKTATVTVQTASACTAGGAVGTGTGTLS